MEEKIRCSVCGVQLNEESAHKFDGEVFCEHCFETKTEICECCGIRIRTGDARGDEYISLCNRCYEEHYTTCEDCGVIIHVDYARYFDEDYDYAYCDECYDKIINRSIKNYSYKPETLFYGSSNLFYGIELEIDRGGEDDDNARKIIDVANKDSEKIYCKHDGSICEGFEIVSHAATMEYHLNSFPWKDILSKAIELGYRSHNTSTCGLHIHAGRRAFGKTYEEQEEAIARVVHFVELHWNELVKFTRRTEANISRWASRYGISTRVKDTYKNAKDKHLGRYVAVNLENCATIEFRIFRGTLRYETFVATLQLVDEICNMAINLTDKEVEDLSWSDFVLNITNEKKELIDYLKLKQLYVNELNTEMEEI